jgi:Amt family ammonium transporter
MIDPTPLQVSAETFAENINALGASINYMWILTVSFLIFFMHAGFAMLEAGQVRSKNVANQLTKNLLTWSIGITVFFLIGAGVSSLVGGSGFNFVPMDDPASWGNGWFYGAVFAMTAATIVSGAVAGRARLRAYVTYTFLLAAVIYPVVTGITWAGGYIQFGDAVFNDFAGGTIVHAMGGVAGLTAAYVLGPRMGRFNEDGSANVIPGHSMTFAVLGTLLLAFGWYGFNVGTASVLSVASVSVENGAVTGALAFNGAVLGRVVMTTTMAMAMGAIGAGLVAWLKTDKVDTLYVANGLLAGLVGITAIPNTTTWWGALLIGTLAGAQLPIVFGLTERLGIDDVCAVFPVHGSAGILGTLAFPFVAADLGPSIANAFIAQVVGVVAILGWTVAATALIWYVLKALGQARVTPAHEQEGLDISEHGVETYPEFGGDEGAVADGGPTFKTDGGRDISDGDSE